MVLLMLVDVIIVLVWVIKFAPVSCQPWWPHVCLADQLLKCVVKHGI